MGRKISLLGVDVDALSVEELHDRIAAAIRAKEHELVLHVNAHGLNLTVAHPWMREFLNQAAIVLPDGIGVSIAARVLGHRPPRRIPITDWIWDLGQFAASAGFSIYLLGGRPDVAQQAAQRLKEKHPTLQIAGTQHGYFEKALDAVENREVIEEINKAQPDILLVGFGMPVQERWLRDNWQDLNAKVAITGGAVMDYASGSLRRGPGVLTNNGFEWLSRLIIEPRRLWRRYLLGNPIFLARILSQRLRMGRLPGKDLV